MQTRPPPPWRFQGLEKISPDFPRLGKFHGIISEPWKKTRGIFQASENRTHSGAGAKQLEPDNPASMMANKKRSSTWPR
jgi:hypothetical protein